MELGSSSINFCSDFALMFFLVIVDELNCQGCKFLFVLNFGVPVILWVKNFRVKSRYRSWHVEVKELALVSWNIVQSTLVDCVDHGQTVFEVNSSSYSVSSVNPSMFNKQITLC
jgi:hypothetical protein